MTETIVDAGVQGCCPLDEQFTFPSLSISQIEVNATQQCYEAQSTYELKENKAVKLVHLVAIPFNKIR